ncbi:Ig-like repeat protein Blp2 [Acinetobacter tjernbergiae]|uniref:Bacterial Ig domain-containing protein n=1 Tax=Acinetobacter tjernbergiae DSM 14971 = CIP 107465 TaxID=1120928 RepID=V2W491_9GAMM|nr:Ig-like repeat protein Blp2 [Acinetobacter tjernbergiae]ESK54779.1 hypothetical protein F990_02396 [Acinetobacter tjernbergiae DSM 14971 = CIP 107465]
MTRVVVSSKKSLNILQDAQIKEVILNQPSIIQIGVNLEDIKSIIKQGHDLIITLKNGEKIVISDFYNDKNLSEHTLAIPNEDGTYAIAQFDDAGKFSRYSSVTQLSQFVYTESPTQVMTTEQGGDDLGISKAQLLKVGLVALAAEGVYLWAVKDDDKDDQPNQNQPIDIIPPVAPTATLAEDMQTIAGKTEASAKVEIKDTTGKVIATTQANQEGNYTIKLDQPLANNNKVTVTAIDGAGNPSKAIVVTGTKDTIAPDAPSAQLNADGTIVSGKTEANAKVSIYDADGKLLGSVNANSAGLYSIKLSSPLTSDKGGTVIAEDAAVNKSTPSKVFAGKDTLAPDQPLVEVNKEGTSILGRAEANAKVQIKDADGKLIGSGITDAQGKFQIVISPALATDKKGLVIIEDAAGNQSKPLEITTGKDTIAPDKATAQLNSAGDSVSGTAEIDAKIQIKDANGKLIGTGVADAQGKFTIPISPALTEKNIGKIYVIDASGNQSDATDILGTKDVTAPAKPSIPKLDDDIGDVKGQIASGGTTDDLKPTISGIVNSAEPKAQLTIYDNGQAIGVVTVANNGSWSFNPNHDLALGLHKITLTQTDAAGNTSEVSESFIFTIVAPTTTVTLLNNETSELLSEQISLADHIELNSIQINPAVFAESTQVEKISINDLLVPSDPSVVQLNGVLDELGLIETSSSPNVSLASSISSDFLQMVKLDPLDQLELTQDLIA